jgi:hypothetical protein
MNGKRTSYCLRWDEGEAGGEYIEIFTRSQRERERAHRNGRLSTKCIHKKLLKDTFNRNR